MIRIATFGLLILFAAGCADRPPSSTAAASAWPSGTLVDLSHAYGDDTIF
jgi:hypothetical protein